MAMKNQTRPSCARVKVEVDLLKEFPKWIKIGMRMKNEEVLEKWIKIKYEYVPNSHWMQQFTTFTPSTTRAQRMTLFLIFPG
ncbi:hypothetical protein H5410_062273 [Solanum commersonii]|uniref:Uncharacterized protein n=1 Tax=Solanum commersonii TaxID=4109 RepID=A0A9J5W9X9_SOLCO|nr:hypothetical protein H5410_062273 [Solanum commersonii]